MYLIKKYVMTSGQVILLILIFAGLSQANALSAERHVTFRHLAKSEEALAFNLLSADYHLDKYIKQGFIHFPQNIRIAYFDLNDDGKNELLLYIRAGFACGTAGCDVLIWKKDNDEWKKIGWIKTYDNGITILSETKYGFHTIHGVNETFHFNGKEY